MFGFVMIRGPPSSTLFPYTTLYGSRDPPRGSLQRQSWRERGGDPRPAAGSDPAGGEEVGEVGRPDPSRRELAGAVRSEEHTSELQSRQYLGCCLLLEKKKHTKYPPS